MSGDSRIIDASPTKDFFIFMLSRDIQLVPAVIDLIDNSLDGALRVRGNADFDNLYVRIELDDKHFRIADNCGGISTKLARQYAFHFGRPPGTPTTPHSVGQFGVGMKRALFKLGKKFRIESTSIDSHFVVEIDVEEWRKDTNPNWEFRFKELDERTRHPGSKQGTVIEVTELNNGVAQTFALENFQSELASAISVRHQESMSKGLGITLNGIPVRVKLAELLSSSELKPAFKKIDLQLHGAAKVVVRIWAGVGLPEPRDSGWYIFCNGRLVLQADQTSVTGWGEGDGKIIPRFHNQFDRFRGYVFFDSDDGSFLPWNTTKTGVEEDSPSFQSARQQMITLMRPVIDFLNWLDAEGKKGAETGPLKLAIDGATRYKLDKVKTSDAFLAPPRALKRPKTTTTITYEKPTTEIDMVKDVLKVTTSRSVGEKTFEYFVDKELGK